LIGIIFTPPDRTSSRPVLSKYADVGAVADDAAGGVAGADEHADVAMAALSHNVRRFMILLYRYRVAVIVSEIAAEPTSSTPS
jgi:hypothetical protein